MTIVASYEAGGYSHCFVNKSSKPCLSSISTKTTRVSVQPNYPNEQRKQMKSHMFAKLCAISLMRLPK
ncbi:hypothetical protein GQ55_6G064300 [Panicum hallii var. hallii]|uniref:Uncharacterized protein n=1 Tax=Panicum hallii var. hallii TaxID=1504633 RepID=A0A2T7D4N8_9POAL|nr:hypothetical protein GQ55_6G064300 [Panicum hallii var. hallii]